jgi:hypothetical protein
MIFSCLVTIHYAVLRDKFPLIPVAPANRTSETLIHSLLFDRAAPLIATSSNTFFIIGYPMHAFNANHFIVDPTFNLSTTVQR